MEKMTINEFNAAFTQPFLKEARKHSHTQFVILGFENGMRKDDPEHPAVEVVAQRGGCVNCMAEALAHLMKGDPQVAATIFDAVFRFGRLGTPAEMQQVKFDGA